MEELVGKATCSRGSSRRHPGNQLPPGASRGSPVFLGLSGSRPGVPAPPTPTGWGGQSYRLAPCLGQQDAGFKGLNVTRDKELKVGESRPSFHTSALKNRSVAPGLFSALAAKARTHSCSSTAADSLRPAAHGTRTHSGPATPRATQPASAVPRLSSRLQAFSPGPVLAGPSPQGLPFMHRALFPLPTL